MDLQALHKTEVSSSLLHRGGNRGTERKLEVRFSKTLTNIGRFHWNLIFSGAEYLHHQLEVMRATGAQHRQEIRPLASCLNWAPKKSLKPPKGVATFENIGLNPPDQDHVPSQQQSWEQTPGVLIPSPMPYTTETCPE